MASAHYTLRLNLRCLIVVAALQSAAPAQLASALQQLVVLMVSRYTCSLQEDQQLLQGMDQLPPRQAAAVTARSAEKEVWSELQQVGGARGPALHRG